MIIIIYSKGNYSHAYSLKTTLCDLVVKVMIIETSIKKVREQITIHLMIKTKPKKDKSLLTYI